MLKTSGDKKKENAEAYRLEMIASTKNVFILKMYNYVLLLLVFLNYLKIHHQYFCYKRLNFQHRNRI